MALLRLERRDVWTILAFALGVGLLSIVTPAAIEALVNTVAFGVLLWPVVILALVMLAFLCFSALLRAMQVVVAEYMQRRIFARTAGRMQPLGIAPRPIVRTAGWVGDLASVFSRRELPVNSAAVSMSMLSHNFSCARAQAELGYAYRSFESTVSDAWNWFLDHGFARPMRERTALAR